MNAVRLWPRHLAAQLLLGMLIALSLTHGIGWLILARDHGELHPVARRQWLDEFTQVARGAAALPDPVQANAVLAALGGPRSHYRLDAGPPAMPGDPAGDATDTPAVAPERAAQPRTERDAADAAAFVDELSRRLVLPSDAVQVRVTRAETEAAQAASADPAGDDDPEALDGPPARAALVEAAVRLPGGAWLLGSHQVMVRTGRWQPVSFWLQLSLVAAVVVAGFAAQRLLRPVRDLVSAAQQASGGEWVPPLQPSGPQEMRDVIQAFNVMQERLRSYVDDRTRLLAAISHDLRTPITSLRLRAELVDDDALRAAMVVTLDDMAAMVDQSLGFGRDEAAREPTQDVPLDGLLHAVVQSRREIGHDIRLAVALPNADEAARPCRCRPLALRRALGNLVDNAVRYGARARLSLSLSDGGATGRRWRIDIDDDGPGIPEALHERAFTPFTRLGSQAAADPPGAAGIGLGLAIARSCIRGHGGEILLGEAPGGGLRATVLLPG